MARLYANNCSSTLAGSISGSATSLTLATGDGAKFPSPSGGDYFDFTLEQGTTREIARCTARSGDVLTITRAVEAIAGVGAVAQAFTTGATVAIRTTAASLASDPIVGMGLRGSLAGGYTPLLSCYTAAFSSGTRTLNLLFLYPFVVSETISLDRLGSWLNVVDGVNASAVARFGLWAHNAANERPGTLLQDGGTVSVFSGSPRWTEVTIAQTLTPGIYWAGTALQGSANVAQTSGFTSSTTFHTVPIRSTPAPGGQFVPGKAGLFYNAVSGAFSSITTAPDGQAGGGTLIWGRYS